MTDQPVKMWVCPVCGYIHYGAEPPEECPVCGAAQAQFEPALETQPAQEMPQVLRWVCANCGYVHEGSQPPDECPVCGATAAAFEPESLPEPIGADSWNGQIVVIGAGIAGVSAVEAARQAAPRAQITLISAEPHLPYYRLSLTRYLAGQLDSSQLNLHPLDWYEQNQIELCLGETVCEIDLNHKALVLDDGRRLPFDRLVLANGAHPFVPPFPGTDRQNVLTLRTRQDAETLLAACRRSQPEVIVIGGGLLGLETAGALARQGAQVQVLENMAWLLPRQLNETAGHLLQKQIEKVGIVVHTNARTKELVGDDQVRGVQLEDGTCLSADWVVISAGVRPNLNLARQAGLQVNQGILVDDCMQTSHAQVFAAGDVCEHRSTLYGTWPPAQLQGAAAGHSAAGQPGHFGGIPRSTALKVLGYDVFSIGKFNPEGPADLQIAAEVDGGYACFVFREGRMLGSILLGKTTLSNEVKQAVETGLDFSSLLQANPGPGEVMRFLQGA